jgi:hypothetical protein
MNKTGQKMSIKRLLGEAPFTTELYWRIRQQFKPLKVDRAWQKLDQNLPVLVEQAAAACQENKSRRDPLMQPKRLLFFLGQRYWIENGVLLGLAMAGYGHEVSLAFVPYIKWHKDYNRFDTDGQNLRALKFLRPISPLVEIVSLLDQKPADELPAALAEAIEEVSVRDVQYTLQVEEFNRDSSLYHLRVERNTQAALAALAWMGDQRPDVVITPNGSILEMGAVYAVARYLGIPVVTYEYGEQRGRIWLAQDAEVMRQETDALWAAHKDTPLTEEQWEQMRALFASRQGASLWENFARLWQGQPAKGGQQVRQELRLDERPVVLLPANVIGDSLTLGRQVFSHTMTEWLDKTIRYFARRQDVQLVVRVHPGERYISGPSVADVAQRAAPGLEKDPNLSHIRLIAALDPVNTYDLIEIADFGLAYTTTVGMEMAMSGVPVMVAGHTHYRGKGFTLDPDSWQAYYAGLEQALADLPAMRPARQQVEQAWNYAYRFFFEYPLPFPWHLLDQWERLETWPMERVLSNEGWSTFGETFRCLAGEQRQI